MNLSSALSRGWAYKWLCDARPTTFRWQRPHRQGTIDLVFAIQTAWQVPDAMCITVSVNGLCLGSVAVDRSVFFSSSPATPKEAELAMFTLLASVVLRDLRDTDPWSLAFPDRPLIAAAYRENGIELEEAKNLYRQRKLAEV